jgi:tRNA threonylcarbamoyladenosine biosynthesis protein TsaB
MIVVALDTTSRQGSCAVAVDGAVVVEVASDSSRPQATRLPGELEVLLARAHVRLDEVDVFAVAVGPGSFTGLRVGIATMQGLAFAGHTPLVGISALDALADIAREEAAAVSPSRIATWVDAWRGEVYAALYADGQAIEAVTVEPPERVLARLTKGAYFIGDGVVLHRGVIEQRLGSLARVARDPVPALAGAIARLAHAAAAAGDRPPADAIRPLYVRRPDAEIARDAHPQR